MICWYLHNHNPIRVMAEKISDNSWFLPELNITVDGGSLFRTPVGVLKALRRKIDREITRRKFEIKTVEMKSTTQCNFLWVIDGGKENEK